MGSDWLLGDQHAAATQHILDAAGRCFAECGVARTTIGDIARAAGCSRPTVYRYFEDRDALRLAFVHRAARHIGAQVAEAVRDMTDPAGRLVEAMARALHAVRSDAILNGWFSEINKGTVVGLAASSDVIQAIAAAFIGDIADDETQDRARWVVRIMLSFLSLPGVDDADERRHLKRYVAPVVVPAAVRGT